MTTGTGCAPLDGMVRTSRYNRRDRRTARAATRSIGACGTVRAPAAASRPRCSSASSRGGRLGDEARRSPRRAAHARTAAAARCSHRTGGRAACARRGGVARTRLRSSRRPRRSVRSGRRRATADRAPWNRPRRAKRAIAPSRSSVAGTGMSSTTRDQSFDRFVTWRSAPFGTTITSPEVVRSFVTRRVSSSTVPVTPRISPGVERRIRSPMPNWRSVNRKKPASRSPTTCWAPKPIATPSTVAGRDQRRQRHAELPDRQHRGNEVRQRNHGPRRGLRDPRVTASSIRARHGRLRSCRVRPRRARRGSGRSPIRRRERSTPRR